MGAKLHLPKIWNNLVGETSPSYIESVGVKEGNSQYDTGLDPGFFLRGFDKWTCVLSYS
jgi:hypothetical protein